MNTVKQVEQMIMNDQYMMRCLQAVQTLHLPDWWICAGFIRSRVWDGLQGYERTLTDDVDVVYFDGTENEEHTEKRYEEMLHERFSGVPWSVKNQARMHTLNKNKPYTSAVDAIAKFPETATAVGAKLDKQGKVHITAPHGITDLLEMSIKPTPIALTNPYVAEIYQKRIHEKNWGERWPKVKER